MTTFHRFSRRYGSTVRQRASSVWESAAARLTDIWQWLVWQWPTRWQVQQWLTRRRRTRRWRIVVWATSAGVISIVLARFIGAFTSGAVWVWTKYSEQHAAVAPLLTLAAGLSVAGVALARHFAQTDADRQRRITESFSKAVEQLGSDKLEVRLGAIYSLERISKESPNDYWTVMESLTAFVRERSLRTEAERASQDFEQRIRQRAYFLWLDGGRSEMDDPDSNWDLAFRLEHSPPTDISAALTVIGRRNARDRSRERKNNWRLDLRNAVLKGVTLEDTHLERALFVDAHLEGAWLSRIQLEGAFLFRVHLQGAKLMGANLNGARLYSAHLEGADLSGAQFKEAWLSGAHLAGARLHNVDFRGAFRLADAIGLMDAYGDEETLLPAGVTRPAHWPCN
jgi:hypothetical protein